MFIDSPQLGINLGINLFSKEWLSNTLEYSSACLTKLEFKEALIGK